MFETDARAIKFYATLTPTNMTHILWFAVATANCPFQQSVNTLHVLRKWGSGIMEVEYASVTQGEKSLMGCGLTASKLSAYQYLWTNRESIFDMYTECLTKDNGHIIFWNYILDTLPGMGMVKAAFAVQMLFNELGCIDIHNARELGYDKAPSGRAKKQRPVYLNMQSIKTSQQWWDDWCNMLAQKYPGQFKSGEHVSRLHAVAIMGAV